MPIKKLGTVDSKLPALCNSGKFCVRRYGRQKSQGRCGMVSSINSSAYSLAGIYNQNNSALSQTLLRLASGKNFQSPSDDLIGYFRSQDLEQQYQKYNQIKPDMQEWKTGLDTAATAGEEVNSSLQRMQELSKLYPTADASAQASYTAEYNAIVSDLTSTISNTAFDGFKLLNSTTTIKKIDITPDATTDAQRLLINPGEAITAAHLTALTPGAGQNVGTMGAAITDATTDVGMFQGNIAAYAAGLQSHLNITDSIMQNTQSVKASITDIDQVKEMLTYTQEDIRSQISMAMMAQANVSQRSMLYLYGLKP